MAGNSSFTEKHFCAAFEWTFLFTRSVPFKMSVVCSLNNKFSTNFTRNLHNWPVNFLVLLQFLFSVKYFIAIVARKVASLVMNTFKMQIQFGLHFKNFSTSFATEFSFRLKVNSFVKFFSRNFRKNFRTKETNKLGDILALKMVFYMSRYVFFRICFVTALVALQTNVVQLVFVKFFLKCCGISSMNDLIWNPMNLRVFWCKLATSPLNNICK